MATSCLNAVFFDFDGVILDSIPIKTRAFAAMFRSFGEDIERQVVAYHLANGGVSRFEKFRHYYEDLLHTKISEEKLAALDRQFSGIIRKEILAAPFIDGALDCLEELQDQSIPAFVVSGVPDEELHFIVKERRLDRFFSEVHGSSKSKKNHLADIGRRRSLRMSQCLMIGDALTDLEAAQATGTMFLGIVNPTNHSLFPAHVLQSPKVQIPRRLLASPGEYAKEVA